MQDRRMKNADPKDFPFDAKRMYWGGFQLLIDL
jgi:uncharacterized protein YbaA (DUF1428 family)